MKRITPRGTMTGLAISDSVYYLSRRTSLFDPRRSMSRSTLFKIAGLTLTAITTASWRETSPVDAATTCVLTPEQTQGPYYIAKEKVRVNISENRPGVPLRLRLAVTDASTCKPLKGATVDIWHCDAGGVYSGFESASTGGPPGGGAGPTDKHTFLRGIQKTNARGISQFVTIYPGWYRGRTVHIHVMVHLGGKVVHTGQLYFPDALTSTVYQSSPYKARAAARDTFNSSDSIYGSGGARSILTIARDGHGGYIGTITMGVRR